MLLAPNSPILNILGFSPAGDLGTLTGYTTKRGKPVWYVKAPPLEPPTGWQRQQRNMFRSIAIIWTKLRPQQRFDWATAARLANLNVTGYNLFVWYQHTLQDAAIHTVERQSGTTLLPLFEP